MQKRHAICGELFFCRPRVPRCLAAFLGLLLAGLSASVALGQELDWARRAGGIGRDAGRDIAVDGAGNSYVTGSFSGTATFGPGEANQTILTSAGDRDIFVAKYDSAGALVWAKRAGAGGTRYDNGTGIAVDGAGNSYVTGGFEGMATFGPGEANQTILPGSGGIFVAKYDSAGALVWAKQTSGTGYDAGIAVDGAGNSYVTAWLYGIATFGPGEANQTILISSGSDDVFVAKYDSVGALVWAKRAGGRDGDVGYGIAVDGAGNSYVTGVFGYSELSGGGGTATFGPGEANQTILTPAGNGDMFLAKYDSGGALVWAKRAGGKGWAQGHGIAVDGTGNSYVTGVFEGMATFGPGEANQTILTSAGDNEVFVARYDSAGALVWAKRATALAGHGIAVDGAGNSYVTGGFSNAFKPTTFGPGEANQTILAGSGGIFVAKYDSAGALVWVKRAGERNSAGGAGIAVDGAGNSYVTGGFEGMATFGPGEANQAVLTSAGGLDDVFVAKYGTADQAGPIASNVVADPNPVPASQIMKLSAKIDDSTTGGSNIASASFEIRDGNGKVVHGGAGDNSACPFPDDLCPRDESGNPEAAPAFDAVMEDVRVSIPAFTLTPGVYIACVRGTDAKGNTGEFQCGSFTIFPAPPPPPSITSVNPNPLPPLNGNEKITINGVGFQTGMGLKVRVTAGGVTTELAGAQVSFLSSLQLTIQFNFGLAAANWTAQVINPDGQSSNIFPFSVSSQLPNTSFALPQFAFGRGWYTALHFSNTTGSVLTVQVSFIADNGTPLNVPLVGIGTVTSRTIDLNPGTTAALEALSQGDLVTGWVEATVPAGVIGYGVFRQSVQGRADQEAVVPLTPVSSQMADLIYDDTSPLTTAAAFLNPSNQQVTLTIIVYGQDGAQIGSAQLVLGARSKQAAMLRNLPGLAAMVGKRGWAAFSVPNGALAVLGLRFGEEAFTTIPVTQRSGAAPAPTTSALPQFAFGGGWYSALYFSNTTGSAVSFQVNFIANNGKALNVPLFGTSQTINLNPGATAILEALNVGPLVTGWAEATLPAGVIGYGVFRQSAQGRAEQEAVVPLTPESSQTAGMIYNDTSVLTTAAAFLNPGNQPVLVTIAVYGEDGAQIALIQLPLQPRAKRAEILKNLPGLGVMVGKRGRIIFSAPNAAVSVLGIRFAQQAFTSIPVSH